MSPKLPVISGDELIKVLQRFGYEAVRQKGSHVRLRHPNDPQQKPVTVPRHKALKRGLLRSAMHASASSNFLHLSRRRISTFEAVVSRRSGMAQTELSTIERSEAGEEGGFGGVDFFAGGVEGEEGGAVHFREFLLLAGARGPLHLEGVAFQLRWFAVVFEGPGDDSLAAFLFHASERNERAFRIEAGFFLEFTLGCRELVFARLNLSFRHKPRAIIFF